MVLMREMLPVSLCLLLLPSVTSGCGPADTAGPETVHPQRGGENPGSQRQVRGQDQPQLGAVQGPDSQLQPRHHLQGRGEHQRGPADDTGQFLDFVSVQ
uniref:Uncharacterized protein n=1 Tax=Seriola lalandi dorsalis TaxID=1841481 RepID=A0A3B4X0W3_SERLL